MLPFGWTVGGTVFEMWLGSVTLGTATLMGSPILSG